MSNCLEELRDHPECPEDSILVQLVRMQLVVEKMTLSNWYDDTLEPVEQSRIPPSYLTHALYSQLENVMTNTPAHLQTNSKHSSTYVRNLI